MSENTSAADPPHPLGRLLYGGVLAYMAYDGFKHNEGRVEAARSKGVPVPEVLVPAVTAMLLVANLGVIFWKFPRASAGAIILFFLGTTPTIHNFWALEGEERHGNKINFLKNGALLGCAIMLLAWAAASDGDDGGDDGE